MLKILYVKLEQVLFRSDDRRIECTSRFEEQREPQSSARKAAGGHRRWVGPQGGQGQSPSPQVPAPAGSTSKLWVLLVDPRSKL